MYIYICVKDPSQDREPGELAGAKDALVATIDIIITIIIIIIIVLCIISFTIIINYCLLLLLL